MTDHTIPEVMMAICALGLAVGAAPLNELAGCWEERLDEHWEIAVNGHGAPTMCSFGHDVPPFHVCVQYNGWPAGLISPYGGYMAAGECANEDALIAAVRTRLAQVEP